MWLAILSGAPDIASAQVIGAQYGAPTSRYAHAVLGDGIEYGALMLETATGPRRITLPKELVFEDIEPRLADVTGDGLNEVVVVESHVSLGARLAIYTAQGRLASTPFIGTRFRWLAPAGIADLTDDGQVEIAYVDRPHLAKVLRIWRLDGAELVPVGDVAGLTNHRIGEAFISGGVRVCSGGSELVLADADWSAIMIVGWSGDEFRTRRLPVAPTGAGFANVLACQDEP